MDKNTSNSNLQSEDVKENVPQSKVSSLYDIVSVFVSALIVIFLVFTFVTRILVVSGQSMLPTLNDGDRVAISCIDRNYKYKDIVIVTQPNKLQHQVLIKRVIAVAGQTVDIDDEHGVVIVDGKPLKEDYTLEPTFSKGNMKYPAVVPEGCVFVMGDNRNNSSDSRITEVGFIDTRYIMGKVIFRVAPFGHFKIG